MSIIIIIDIVSMPSAPVPVLHIGGALHHAPAHATPAPLRWFLSLIVYTRERPHCCYWMNLNTCEHYVIGQT